eukprot:COSAG01_NODE_1358_length_10584_cov_204.052546_5_plen_66_part_00
MSANIIHVAGLNAEGLGRCTVAEMCALCRQQQACMHDPFEIFYFTTCCICASCYVDKRASCGSSG